MMNKSLILALLSFSANAGNIDFYTGFSFNLTDNVYEERELHNPIGHFGLKYTPAKHPNTQFFAVHYSSIPSIADNYNGVNLVGVEFVLSLK